MRRLKDCKMPEMVKVARARARKAKKPYEAGEGSDDLVDMITDVLHLAESKGIDPDFILERAQEHFEAER